MKRAILITAALLLVSSLLLTKASRVETAPSSLAQQGKEFFDIYETGALKTLRDRNGAVLFDERNPANEGYSFAYQVLEKSGKPKGLPVSVFAINHQRSDVIECSGQISAQPAPKTFDCPDCRKKWAAAAKIATADIDKTLRVNSNFYYQEGRLRVVRLIQNIGNSPVMLLSARVQYDVRLAKAPTAFGIVAPPHQKTGQKVGQLRASVGAFPELAAGFLAQGDGISLNGMPISLPCAACPPFCEVLVDARAGVNGVICAMCQGTGKGVMMDIAPTGTQASNVCPHPIGVDVLLAGTVAIDPGSGQPRVNIKLGEKVCVKCPVPPSTGWIITSIAAPGGGVFKGAGNSSCDFTISNRGNQTGTDVLAGAVAQGAKPVMLAPGQVLAATTEYHN